MSETDILNWRRIAAHLTTSGQPTEAQLGALKDLGVTKVINLAPHSNQGSLADEAGSLAALGIPYVNIPVDFDAPQESDFAAFCEAMEKAQDDTLHVHCIFNARVSAFMYRYAKEGRGHDPDALFDVMDGIWRPGGVWAKFIGDPGNEGRENQFAGFEYNPPKKT
ncbi:MAG: protein tyrosine phosphatase family protein [Pseudomonadota bacterium]